MATEPEDPHARTADRNRRLLTQREAILAQFADDPAVQEWLRQFRDDGKGFLDKYADNLAEVLVDGPWPYEHQQQKVAALRQEAIERLWEIQQRKLLLLQCRWRANELRLPTEFVELTDDFESWGQRIHECPYLDPITPAEVEDYLSYLLSDFCRDANSNLDRSGSGQDYERYKHWHLLRAEGINPARVRDGAFDSPPPGMRGLISIFDAMFLDYPRYYRWCDDRDGPPNLLLLLPDTRGEQELYFMCYGRDGKDPHEAATNEDDEEEEFADARPVETPDAPPAPPTLEPGNAAQLEALLRLEAPELLPYHRAYLQPPVELTAEEEQDDDDENDDEDDEDDADIYDDADGDEAADRWLHDPEAAREAADELLTIPERIPIRAAADWREGVIRAWVDWRKRQLAALIREEFAAYQTRARAGQPHPPVYGNEANTLDTIDEVRQDRHNWILDGRELAGFPRDLNF